MLTEANKNKSCDICALCGKKRKLTFEHIPPRAALNNKPVKVVTGEALINQIGDSNKLPWDMNGVQYTINQKGSGRYSLCEECNNKTGHWYGAEYKKFTGTALSIVFDENVNTNSNEINAVEISSIYPLRVIKQILSMFCSISGANKKMQTIRNFVLDKEIVGLPRDRYKLCMYFTQSSLARQYSMFVICSNGKNGTHMQMISEITALPLGFILYFDPKPDDLCKGFDITCFSNYHYDEICNVTLPLILYEINSTLPLDFRTKDEIKQTISENNNAVLDIEREHE